MTMFILAYPIGKIYLHYVYQLSKMTHTLGSRSSHYAILLDCADDNGVKVDAQAPEAASKGVTNILP